MITTVSQENGLAVSPALAQVRDREKLQKTSRVAKHTEEQSGMAQLLLKMYSISYKYMYCIHIFVSYYLRVSRWQHKKWEDVLPSSLMFFVDDP